MRRWESFNRGEKRKREEEEKEARNQRCVICLTECRVCCKDGCCQKNDFFHTKCLAMFINHAMLNQNTDNPILQCPACRDTLGWRGDREIMNSLKEIPGNYQSRHPLFGIRGAI